MDGLSASQKHIFPPDDFDRIYSKYFKKLIESSETITDLSYWYESIFPGGEIIPEKNINKYKSDYKKGLLKEKEILINAINSWDFDYYSYNNITICSSVTTASLMVLSFLKNNGVEIVFFETPAYFACIEQAKSLSIEVRLIPTYFRDNFQITESNTGDLKNCKKKKAFWVTQPRFALGINQHVLFLKEVLGFISKDDYLIIDEATEQFYPVYLKEFNFKLSRNIIKMRSFFKGSGLNGPRISFILHHTEYRQKFENILEVLQGAIDCFSLEFAQKHLKNLKLFKNLLKCANTYVNNINNKLLSITRNTFLSPSILKNGYIGSTTVNLNEEINYYLGRERLLKYCVEEKTIIILGATMYFAKDLSHEHIRINYFNTEQSIIKGIEKLLRFSN